MLTNNPKPPTGPGQVTVCRRHAPLITTVVYMLLYPFVLQFGLMSGMIFGSPHITVAGGLAAMFCVLLIPLSMPISVYMMWASYLKGLYQKVLFYRALPIITTIAVVIIFALFSALSP